MICQKKFANKLMKEFSKKLPKKFPKKKSPYEFLKKHFQYAGHQKKKNLVRI